MAAIQRVRPEPLSAEPAPRTAGAVIEYVTAVRHGPPTVPRRERPKPLQHVACLGDSERRRDRRSSADGDRGRSPERGPDLRPPFDERPRRRRAARGDRRDQVQRGRRGHGRPVETQPPVGVVADELVPELRDELGQICSRRCPRRRARCRRRRPLASLIRIERALGRKCVHCRHGSNSSSRPGLRARFVNCGGRTSYGGPMLTDDELLGFHGGSGAGRRTRRGSAPAGGTR